VIGSGVTPEREIFRKRIDNLLDELGRQKALYDACIDLGRGDPVLIGEIQHLADECLEENHKLKRRIGTMRQFVNACDQTGYRPYAWELKLILDGTPEVRP
jgi:hypothetical protein